MSNESQFSAWDGLEKKRKNTLKKKKKLNGRKYKEVQDKFCPTHNIV